MDKVSAGYDQLTRFWLDTAPARGVVVRLEDSLTQAMLGWVCGCGFVYAALFGTGSALYGLTAQASLWAVVFIVSGYGLIRILNRLWTA